MSIGGFSSLGFCLFLVECMSLKTKIITQNMKTKMIVLKHKTNTMKKTIIELFAYTLKPYPIQQSKTISKESLYNVFYLFVLAYGIKITWLLTVNRYLRKLYEVDRSEIVNTEEQSLWVFFCLLYFFIPL